MKKFCKYAMMVLAIILALAVLTGCRKKTTVDLTEYMVLTTDGPNGYGSAGCYVDSFMLLSVICSDASDAEWIAKAELIDRIDCVTEEINTLSNGDKVSVTITYPDTLEDALGVSLNPKSGTVWAAEITDLPEPERIDLFEDIYLDYDDEVNMHVKGGYSKKLQYNLSQSLGLSNGDTVTITVSVPDGIEELDEYCVRYLGGVPMADTCEYVVEEVDEYPLTYEDIPAELFDMICQEAESKIEDLGQQMYDNFGDQGYRMNNYTLERVLVAYPMEGVESPSLNEVYLVYKINATNLDGTFDYYYSGIFPNVQTTAEGEQRCDWSLVCYPDGNYGFSFYGEHYFCTGTEGEGFIGFATFQDFYDCYLTEWEDTWVINQYTIES